MKFTKKRSFFCLCFLLSATVLSAQENVRHFDINSWAFDRGNFSVYQDAWRNGGPVIIANNPGVSGQPMFAEYDIPFPVSGQYSLSVFVAMQETRPITVYLDGTTIGSICAGSKRSTSWNSIDAIWDVPLEFSIVEPGLHTIKLVSEAGPPPHLAVLRFVAEQPLPNDWKLERPIANKLPPPPEGSTAHISYTVPNAEKPNPDAIRRAINDLIETFGPQYSRGAEYLAALDRLDSEKANLEAYDELRRQALLFDNPYIDFDQILFVRRHTKGPSLALPVNWNSNSDLPRRGYDDEIMTLSIKQPDETPISFYKPPRDTAITDLDLHFDADRLMFSAIGENDRWHLFEINVPLPSQSRQLTKSEPDVDFYDSCYMPNGNIMLTSTAPMIGVPCVYGAAHVANLFVLEPTTGAMRQIGFDQDHNWNPTMLNNGRVLYTRWEYADIPHSNSRLLFHCNPDGTLQLEYYGSNSYWPASVFFARPLPDHPTQVIAVIGGHHDHGRLGELVLFDPAISRREAEGAVQRLPGWGKKVEGPVADGLTRNSWPKFVHPYPISQKHFLVAAMPKPGSPLGLYLIDLFDNMILIKEMPNNALVEPIPLRKTPTPPIIPTKVDLQRDDATVFVSNVLDGPGLEGIPPGVVKSLRVYTYHFAYHNIGGLLGSVGQDGPWDVRGVLGTVPVENDGSAYFRTPANLPIAVLPLDADGQALQLMRSWMTPMPGENLQCNGCHESQNSVPPPLNRVPMALVKPPAEIQPYNTPNDGAPNLLGKINVRGFSFQERVQPILDRHCVVCHNGTWEPTVKTARVADRPVGTSLDGRPFPIDLRGDVMIQGHASAIAGYNWVGTAGKWTVGYDNLQRFVRRPGIESDYHLLVPMEFAANTTELVQILKGRHYDVQLSENEWEDLLTWIDMNTPYHGSWMDIASAGGKQHVEAIAKRRIDLAQLYGVEAIDFEDVRTNAEPSVSRQVLVPTMFKTPENSAEEFFKPTPTVRVELKQRRPADGIVLEGIELVPIEYTGKIVKATEEIVIEHSFFMGQYEITNAQFRLFDPSHDSRVESRSGYQFGRRGYDVNADDLPVVRIDWRKAMAFCRWLSDKTGHKVDLPTAAEWEFACRAGTMTPFWFGDFETDFSPFENLGDTRLKEFVACTTHNNYTAVQIIANPNPFDDRYPKDERFDDGALLHVSGGQYKSNPWGLFDMHGNVAEFTKTTKDGRDVDVSTAGNSDEITVMGGSWYDRPYRSTSDFKRYYPVYQPVFNTGFRIVVRP
ncbi:MAG: SUMF1/EgtB/PvdO family nonheme iron enzyme [Planctomycetaceae bacterium]|nr:SUMF1/EgtB/PvdO family nonheme iron enzyme [Planctomycetaceae bacterium]